MGKVSIQQFQVGSGQPLLLIAGPCVIESESLSFEVATKLKEISERLQMPFVFKASYDKANRTAAKSFRGPGLHEGLSILQKIKKELQVPILSDIHQVEEIDPAAQVLDILQIPAFLCRQTDLIRSAAKTQKIINIKKGQFLSPTEMKFIVEKIVQEGNQKIFLTERGTTFGYHDLVADMRSLSIMKSLGYPVIFDCTHAVQSPGSGNGRTLGQREFAPLLAQAAVATGKCDGIFMEVHPDPDRALSDSATMIPLSQVEDLLKKLQKIAQVVR